MKKILEKLKIKKKSDPAYFTKKQIKEKREKELQDSLKKLNADEKKKKETIKFLNLELKKYEKDKKNCLELSKAINNRFKVEITNTEAARFKKASIYFNALEVKTLPKDYYPYDPEAPELFSGGSDIHYQLWNFQIATQDKDKGSGGHTIPERPGEKTNYVIHGFLFPMTSSVIYLNRYKNEYRFIYNPSDEILGREYLSNYYEFGDESYAKVLKAFYDKIDEHLEDEEERYYERKKAIE